MDKKPIKIFIINYDWRNVFRDRLFELEEKLERDRLEPKVNTFFLFSWGKSSYYQKTNNFEAKHQKIFTPFFKPLYDLLTIFFAPYCIFKFKFRPDAIVVYDFGFLPAAWIVKLFFGGQLIMAINNMPKDYSAVRIGGKVKAMYSSLLEKLFHNLPEKYFTINQAMKSYLMGIGVPAERIHIFAMNTIERDMSWIRESQKMKIRSKYNMRPEQKIFLAVARLEAEKDYPRLLRIIAQLSDDYVLIILGQGSLLDELRILAQDLKIAHRVHFAGFVERKDIWDYYHDADIFILLSKVEALGVVFWEAMYMGVPAIGSTAPGIVENLGRHGERGLIIEPEEDIDSIKNKIKFMLAASDARTAMLARARQYVEKEIANKTTINDLCR